LIDTGIGSAELLGLVVTDLDSTRPRRPAKARFTLVPDSTAATEEVPINHIPALSA
jgi:hypothetical protein